MSVQVPHEEVKLSFCEWNTPLGQARILVEGEPIARKIGIDIGEPQTPVHEIHEALGTVLSLYLKQTDNPKAEEEIVQTLGGISSLGHVMDRGKSIGSVAEAVVQSLIEHRARPDELVAMQEASVTH